MTAGTLPGSICPKCDQQDPEEAGEAATWKPQQFTESPKLPLGPVANPQGDPQDRHPKEP